jgi:glycosyltransferase involved in cell wall biosynthesis
VLAPAFNEEVTIVESINSLLALHYPQFEVIVINDGIEGQHAAADDRPLRPEPVERFYDLAVKHNPIRGLYASPRLPRLLVVDKENGGKSDALNAGINVARASLFCSIDADSLLESDALLARGPALSSRSRS